MKQIIIIFISGLILIAGVFSIAESEICGSTVRIGKSLVKTSTQHNSCEKEIIMVGRGMVPNISL